MEFFKKAEPTIQAETPVVPVANPNDPVPAMHIMSNAGGLSQMMQENLRISEENNVMLRHMQTMDRFSFWIRVVVWCLVLGLPVLFFQPILEFVRTQATENPALFGLPSQDQFQKVFGGQQQSEPVQ